MKILARLAVSTCMALAMASAHAQSDDVASAAPYSAQQGAYTEEDLDQMLAPIALYPDELLSQVLMAATYPLEVVQAARWSRAHPEAQGEEAVAAVDDQDWDPSVKSLVAFPNVVEMMSEQLDWTQRVGEAFLAQEADVTRSVQKLRRAAYDEGNLASSDEMVVSRDGGDIALDPPSPESVYVPYYDPRQVYGPWWWPNAAPVYWTPWPGYYVGGFGFAWSVPIVVGANFFFGDFDWRRHHVRLHDTRPFYFHGRDHRPILVRNHEWRHDPHHRRDVPYRNPVARSNFASGAQGNARRDERLRNRPQQLERAPQPSNANPMARNLRADRAPNAQPNPVTRPSQSQGFFPAQPQPQPQPVPQRPAESRGFVPNGGTRAPRYVPQPPVVQQLARPQVIVPQQGPHPQQIVVPREAPQNPVGRPQARPAPAQAQERPAPPEGRGDRR
ncbi:MAG TPA: DUF3300 domain-containing protein [Usitatibacter sp.]|jgi:hypothetical protein|nr:DUF3300 domain-containing protein [Usitatibacter sp.]